MKPVESVNNFQYLPVCFQTSLTAEDYERLSNFILQELDMALNHTHDTMNQTMKDDEKNNMKSVTKTSTEDDEVNHGDLLDGRTLLEVEALLIMLITRMKIKGEISCVEITITI